MSTPKKKWKGRLINYAFFGLILFLLVNPTAKSWLLRQVVNTGIFSANIQMPEKDSLSRPAAALTFTDENGGFHSTGDLKGRVVFINFWASWCPPCRAEMPSLNKMYERLKDDPQFFFVFINLDDQPDKGKAYLKSNQFSLPFYRAGGAVSSDIYSGTLPTTVVLDKKGVVVMKHTGMANYDSEKFIRQLHSLK